MSERGLHGYVRAVERALAALDDRPIVLSPREWNLLSDWFEQGIPLALILESLDEHMESRSKKRIGRPKLGALREAVGEAWSVMAQDRVLGEGH
ncbi:hypothetical protein ABI59_03395 [Acidobacteria bacterium Mor1]|nr:hypothetical protein ABI59_03395 [Acidobacteria bacterium Mor1]